MQRAPRILVQGDLHSNRRHSRSAHRPQDHDALVHGRSATQSVSRRPSEVHLQSEGHTCTRLWHQAEERNVSTTNGTRYLEAKLTYHSDTSVVKGALARFIVRPVQADPNLCLGIIEKSPYDSAIHTDIPFHEVTAAESGTDSVRVAKLDGELYALDRFRTILAPVSQQCCTLDQTLQSAQLTLTPGCLCRFTQS